MRGKNPRAMRLCLFLILTLTATRTLSAQDRKKSTAYPLAKSAGVAWAKQALQGFSMKLWISNQLMMGQAAWFPFTPPTDGECGTSSAGGGIGAIYQVGTSGCIEHLYGAGPMIGGLLYDPESGTSVRRVSEGYNGTDFRTEFFPEIQDTLRDKIWVTKKNDLMLDYNFDPPRLLAQPVNRRGCDDDGDGRIDEDELDGRDNDGDWNPLTDDVGADGLPDSLEAGCNGPYDPVTNPDPAFDNYQPLKSDLCRVDASGRHPRMSDKNRYTEKNGIPDHGEPHVDEDYGAVS